MAKTQLTHTAFVLAITLGLLGACGSDSGADTVDSSQVSSVPNGQESTGDLKQGDSLTTDPSSDLSSAESTAENALSLTRVWFGDLDAMVERRIIRVLTVYGPGRYYLQDGPRGITAEYAKRLQKEVNATYKTGNLKIVVMVIPVARDQLFSALQAGRGDIVIAGTTITGARTAQVDFTIPYSKPLSEVLVTGPSAPPLKSIDDLAGQTIFVRQSSSYAESARALSERLVDAGKSAINIEYVSDLLEDEDLIEMVNIGLLPWAIVDDYKPQMWEGVFNDITIRKDLVFRKGARLGWALRENSPKLKAFLDDFLKETKEGTLFGNILRNRYVRDFDWASNALAVEELSKYHELKEYFVRHGQAYGMNPSLLAAQGYQESRLRQDVRSAAGAVGIMQLLPSTASDKNVGIDNIYEIDPNIEAGAKYMAFLRSRYFSGEEYDSLNSSLLALAAYNAGPAKIRRLQRTAKERGYDPTRWFDHVEVMAAEQIGRETTQYVANIFKYFLSYEMIDRQAQLRDSAKDQFERSIDS